MFTEDQQGGRQDKRHFEDGKTPRPGSCQEDFSLKVGNWQAHKLAYSSQREEHERPECVKGGGSTEKVIAVEVVYPPLKEGQALLWSGGFPCGSAGKESAWNAGDLGSIPRLGRSPGEGKGYPCQ